MIYDCVVCVILNTLSAIIMFIIIFNATDIYFMIYKIWFIVNMIQYIE